MNGKSARAEFRKRERRQGRRLMRALMDSRQQFVADTWSKYSKLLRINRWMMNAHNHHSRAFWFTVMAQELARHLAGDPSLTRIDQPIYFVTIIDRQQVIDPAMNQDDQDEEISRRRTPPRMHKPEDFLSGPTTWDRKRVRRQRPRVSRWPAKNPAWNSMLKVYAKCLAGFNCIGVLDAALYVSARRVLFCDRLISVHAHALVWNIIEAELMQRAELIRNDMQALVPYATSIDIKQIDPSDYLQMVWYVIKMPRKQYQVHQRTTCRVRQYRRPINGVNSVRLYDVMKDLTLNQLTFAQGTGKRVLARMEERLARRKPTQINR